MPVPPSKDPTNPGTRHTLLGGGWSLAALAVIWAAVFLHLAEQHHDAVAAARGNAASLSRTYAGLLIHNLRDIEQTLFYVRALHARDGAALDLQPWVNSAELASRTTLRISITDRNGSVIISDLHRLAVPIDLSNRPSFRHFADAGTRPIDDRLFIGTPVPGTAPSRWSVDFARPLMTARGEFDGIVSVSVDPDALIRSSQAMDVGSNGVLTLTGLDGIVLASAGGTAGTGPPVGRLSASPAVARVAAEAEGGFDWRDPGDAERRIVSFRRIAGFPLLVEVALATGEALQGVRNDVIAVLSAGLLLSVAVAMAGFSVNRRAIRLVTLRQALHAALEHIDLGLIMVEPGGRMAVVNQRAVELLDIPERFTAGERFAALLDWQRRAGEFKHGEPPVVRPQLPAARPELATPACYRRMRPNGTVLEVRTHSLPHRWTMRTYGKVAIAEPARAEQARAEPPPAPAAAEPATAEPTGSLLPPADHLAVEHLTASLGSGAVAGIVATFLDGLPRQLERMRDLAQGGDTDPLLREVHALADSAATLGLDELGAAASELEQDLKHRGASATAARLDRIDRLARSGLDRLAAFLHDRAA